MAMSVDAQAGGGFDAMEATIAEIHDALERGDTTCRELVKTYIMRISTYDKSGPAFNSIITINPDALTTGRGDWTAGICLASQWGELARHSRHHQGPDAYGRPHADDGRQSGAQWDDHAG